jgi:hypothetical protein
VIFGHQLVGYLDVEIALVFVVGFVLEDAAYLLSLLYGQDFSEVEDGLLPVRIFGVRACGEADWLMACCEVDIEPSDQGMYEIISTDVKGEGRGKSEVGGFACVEIEGEDSSRISDYGFDFDGVNEWLSQSGVL